MDVTKYITSLNYLAENKRSLQFSQEIGLPFHLLSQNDNNLLHKIQESLQRVNVSQYCINTFSDAALATAVSCRIETLVALVQNDLSRAYKSMLNGYCSSLDYLSNKDEDEDNTWFLLTVIRLSNDLRIVATKADQSMNDSENTLLRDSLQSLTRGWTLVAKDRTPITNPSSKKVAIFAMTNVLFKIYFSLNTLSLCTKLINVVEGPSSGQVMQNMQLFPVSDVVMYKYYNGRLKMFEDKYEEARECLRFALKYTPRTPQCFANCQRILVSLIPVEMCLGVLPRSYVQTQYGLSELVELGRCVMYGDVKTFEYILDKYQRSFIKIGIYLVLEQMKHIIYRSLFKRIYRIVDSTRINLVTVEVCLKWLGNNDINLDEIECLLANLIYQGKIKGYLSHQKRFLVLSKTDPFPATAVIKPYSS